MKSINRRDFLKTIGVTAVASSLPIWLNSCGQKNKRPNILFLFSDDHALASISAYGSKINKTPNIDRIANEGTIFQHNTCCNSICAPSRAAILTGKHSHANGKMTNLDTFDHSQQTFPQIMQKDGYTTALIGKLHMKGKPRGFDYWEILRGQGHYYNPEFLSENGEKRSEGYCPEIITNKALDWLDKNRSNDKPFMLMCQYKSPHRTWAPGPDYLTMYDDVTIPEPETLFDDYSNRSEFLKDNEMEIGRHLMYEYDLKITGSKEVDALGRAFQNPELGRMTPEQRKKWDAAYNPKNEKFLNNKPEGKDLVRWKYQRYIKDYLRCIAAVDDNIGRLLNYLEKTGQAENTLVMYSSDQGFYLGEHGWYDKRWMYEESLAMPLVARWPKKIKPGGQIEKLTQNIDFAPTFLDAAGIDVPDDMQGESLLPLLEGKIPNNWRNSIYYHYYEEGEHNVPAHEGVRTETDKLINFYNKKTWEMYDLVNDPNEMKNIYDDPKYIDLRNQLHTELNKLKKQYKVKS
jgi:arylsulfatase A-like enzyme